MDFSANSTRELRRCVNDLAIRVPLRGLGRTTSQFEQYFIQRLLHLLLENDRLDVPFELKKRERPDFEITAGATISGVETIEAVNRSYAHADALRNGLDHDTVLDKSYFKWGKERDRGEIQTILAQRRLTGSPWVGDSVEREFSRSIRDCVDRKHSKLMGDYCRFEKNWLLIYHNNSTPIIDFHKAMAYTDECLRSYWSREGFDAVFVLKYDRPTRLIIFSIEYPTELLVEGVGAGLTGERQFKVGSCGGGSPPTQTPDAQSPCEDPA